MNKHQRIILIVVAGVIGLILLVTLLAIPKKNSVSKTKSEQLVLIISLDGFRYDYLHRGFSPNLLKFAALFVNTLMEYQQILLLAKDGVQAEFMRPQFPTKTFPNHYTIVTGLYPESHGIVENDFYDEKFNESFSLSSKAKFDPKWWGGEPIWVTAKKQGLKSAAFFWPGSDVESEEKRPNYWKVYNGSVPVLERIDQVITWLKLEANLRPTIALMYFEEPDKSGHKYGPSANETNFAIKKTDEYFGILLEKLKSNKLTENLNIIVLSDHGMAYEDTSSVIYIDQILGGLKDKYPVGQNAGSMVYLRGDAKNSTSTTCHQNVDIMYKNDGSVPKRMHFTNNRRIGDIIISPKVPWVLQTTNVSIKFNSKGYHGVDNLYSDMQAIFIASGPAFKTGFVSAPFQNIEVYNLISSILKLKPAPNNGTFGSLNHLLLPNSVDKFSVMDKEVYPFRLFPEKVNSNCDKCICPYCSRKILYDIESFTQNLNLSKKDLLDSQAKHFPYSLPSGGGDGTACILIHRSFITGYSTALRIPLWVGYQLHRENLMININRSNCFRQDIRLTSNESSFCSSYSKSGYDRGHMAPSGDFNHDVFEEQDTNVLSNIAPQYPYFNRGPWQKLEDLVRNWTKHYGSLHVISGSIFDADDNGVKDDHNQFKRRLNNEINGVAIPTHYYKILSKCGKPKDNGLCDGDLDTLSFILPHSNATICIDYVEYIKFHVASIKDIESMTGSLFFTKLPADERARLVSRLNTDLW